MISSSNLIKHNNRIDKIDELLDFVLSNKEYEKPEIDLTSQRIILYGAGDLGLMAVELLMKVGITPTFVVDKYNNKPSSLLNGVEIISPEEISKDDLENALFVICIVKMPYYEIKNYLSSIGCVKIAHFYDLTDILHDKININNGWNYHLLSDSTIASIRRVYNILDDEISKTYYLISLYWRILHKEIFFEEAPINIEDKFFPKFIMEIITDNEVFVDCGAYTGNTIQKFLTNCKMSFKKVIAYEPDEDNFSKMKGYVCGLNTIVSNKIRIEQVGIGQKTSYCNFLKRGISSRFCENGEVRMPVVALDDEINEPVSFIKMHLEGMELEALKGAYRTIISSRPILAITLYHSEEGCFKIPLFLMDNINSYRFFYRLHMHCGQSSVLYAIPGERFKMKIPPERV